VSYHVKDISILRNNVACSGKGNQLKCECKSTDLHDFETIKIQQVADTVENAVRLSFPSQQPEQFHWKIPSSSSTVAASA